MKKLLRKILGIILATILMLQIIPHAMAETEPYLYNVTDVAITNLMGTPIIYTGGSCTLQATIQKNWQSNTNGIVVVMGYSADNTLLSLDFMYSRTNIEDYYGILQTGKETTTYGTTISLKEGESLALVKVAIWENLESMKPLSQVGVYTPNEEFVAPPLPVLSTKIDGALVHNVDGYSNELSVYKSATSSTRTIYKLTDSAQLYVNGFYYCDVFANEATVSSLLQASTGKTELFLDENYTGEKYGIISTTVYASAAVQSIKTSGNDAKISLASLKYPYGVSIPGTTIDIKADDIAEGNKIVKITKNGVPADVSSLAKGDIIAVKYDMSSSFNNSYIIEITATDSTVTGQYRGYDADTDSYLIDDSSYKASKHLMLDLGTKYTFKLDPFGRLFSAEEVEMPKNYAVVERYVNVNDDSSPNFSAIASTHNYIDVVTFDGEGKTLYIASNYGDTAEDILAAEMGIGTSNKATAQNVPMEERIVEYKLDSSGKISELSQVDTYLAYGEKYNSKVGFLGNLITENAAVLDATAYDTSRPKPEAYKASSLSALVDGGHYDAILFNPDANIRYRNIVIKSKPPEDFESDTTPSTPSDTTYNCETDFAVAAERASLSSAGMVGEEIVYKLRVLENGAGETSYLNIAKDAVIMVDGQSCEYAYDCSAYIKEGSAFFYTTNADGFADRIDVILKGGYSFYNIIRNSQYDMVSLPDNSDGKTILPEEWLVSVDEDNFPPDVGSKIQLFMAPVVVAAKDYVIFGEWGSNNNYTYVDTNILYPFALTADTKVYSYDLADDAETNYLAFGKGEFAGLDRSVVSYEGYAYTSVLGNYIPDNAFDFDGLIQMAFVMAVDGVVTNAIVFNN